MPRTFELDDGTEVRCSGRDLCWIQNDDDGRYRIGSLAVAWYVDGDEIEQYETDDGEWDWRQTGRVIVCMVGDDHYEARDRDELTPLGDLDYCAVCGQVGCCHDGRDRD